MKIQKKTGIGSLNLLYEALQKSGSMYLPNADYIAVKNTRGIILDYLRQHPEAILTDLAREQQISYKGIEWHFTKMKKDGLIKHVGPSNGGHWDVIGSKD